GVAAFHLLDFADLSTVASGSAHNTDNHTLLEYRAPKALLAENLSRKNFDLLDAHRTSKLPRDFNIGDPSTALIAAAETMLDLEDYEEAAHFLNLLPKEP